MGSLRLTSRISAALRRCRGTAVVNPGIQERAGDRHRATDTLEDALLAARPEICARWESMLHEQQSRHSNLDALAFMVSTSFDEVIEHIRAGTSGLPEGHPLRLRCDRNPVAAYFAAGAAAFQQTLARDGEGFGASMTLVNHVLNALATREGASFCAMCCYRSPQCASGSAAAGGLVGESNAA